MIRSVQQLRGTRIEATDGSIGEIYDVYFDDSNWTVRYYVVDTGKWLPGRKVLIPPDVIRHQTSPDHTGMPVNLTREQVWNSPDMDTERPISRQAELVLYRHYGWTPYWFPLEPAVPVIVEGDAAEREREATSGHYGGDPNLRSAKEVIGYHVAATDGEIGHIEDFLLDDESGRIRYAVVDTRKWLAGKSVLIAPEWIHEVKWSESKVFVNATREAVRNSPEYNPVTPVERGYESRLFSHYGYPVPWL
jgi:uncharacterized protein YrrD